MPGINKKLLIFAAVDGLILQPAPPRSHPPSTQQAIKIDYKGRISPLLKDRREETTSSAHLEAHGIVGLLKIASSSFLISISSREQVALVKGKPVYTVTDVALIPLASRAEANGAITQINEYLRRKRQNTEEDVVETDLSEEEGTITDSESLSDSGPVSTSQNIESDAPAGQNKPQGTSVAEDVINKKGLYGRFAESWFSRKGWNADTRRTPAAGSEENLGKLTAKKDQRQTNIAETDIRDDSRSNDNIDTPSIPTSVESSQSIEQGVVSLVPKLLRTAKLYFGSRSFFFSYDCDLSRNLALQGNETNSQPLFKKIDPLYFWNYRLASPFIEAGQHSFVLPLIQGFVGQREFTISLPKKETDSAAIDSFSQPVSNESTEGPLGGNIDSPLKAVTSLIAGEPEKKDFLLTLISRRSVKRAGLRYLRRGVDEEGNVANSVETEQILSSPEWGSDNEKVYSFTQYRGSIPLFFSQSPFSLKPLPSLYGTPEINASAFKKHFQALFARYSNVQVASLVDKHGTEAKVGKEFEKHAEQFIEQQKAEIKIGKELNFEWFDFHNVCRGMRFENVSVLMETLKPKLEEFGWTIREGENLLNTQSGVLRTNCMDCLDRTNVVQAACARGALERQLLEQGIDIDLQNDPSTAWFNTLWADNGDAISRQYAGTAALKGDYTRTRQRKISGALTDFGLTLSRYYNNIVNDYFAQAMIDFFLGKATETIFADFEADMKMQDYAIDLRKVRQTAIDRCTEIVVERSEDLVAGWTLSCPQESNTLRTLPFQECVLLLTEQALYFCLFNWSIEKLKEFERVDFDDIEAVARGAYITSTLAQRHMDEKKNVGFVIKYHSGENELRRVNTRSLDSEKKKTEQKSGIVTSTSRILAFKALPPKSSFINMKESDSEPLSELQLVKLICDDIVRVANASRVRSGMADTEERVNNGEASSSDKILVVEERDIISLKDAKRATGYLEQIGYSLMKWVWG